MLPAPFGPAANGLIVYSANGDIMAVDADASNPRALVGGAEADVAVNMSPDGTRFAFVRRHAGGLSELLIANIDGTDVVSLPTEPLRNLTSADWSPDGKMLVAIHDTPGAATLSILPTDGSGSRRDLDLGRVSINVPDTSSIGWLPPDGRELAFRGFEPGGVALYAIRPDGTGLRRIVPLEANEASYLGLRLSPDGTRATFWHNRRGETSDGWKAEVHVLDLATGRDVRIAFDPRSHHEYLPRFSPDGRSILLAQVAGVTDETRLLIAAADGSGLPRQVGPVHPYWGGNPVFDFSPDGAQVVLSFGVVDVTEGMQVIDIDTGVVVPGPVADYPSWQRTAQ